MKPETILYGTRVGEPDWREEIIYGGPSDSMPEGAIDRAKDWATANGFDRLRVFEWDGSAPDFVKAVTA